MALRPACDSSPSGIVLADHDRSLRYDQPVVRSSVAEALFVDEYLLLTIVDGNSAHRPTVALVAANDAISIAQRPIPIVDRGIEVPVLRGFARTGPNCESIPMLISIIWPCITPRNEVRPLAPGSRRKVLPFRQNLTLNPAMAVSGMPKAGITPGLTV